MFTAKEMRGVKPQDSIAFRKLLANKNIAAVLDQKMERIAVWKRMKDEASKTQDGRLTRDGMRRVLGSLRSGKESTIDVWKEAIPLAHEVLPGRFTNRYLSERSDGAKNSGGLSSKSSMTSCPRGPESGFTVSGSSRFSSPMSPQSSSSPKRFPIRPAF